MNEWNLNYFNLNLQIWNARYFTKTRYLSNQDGGRQSFREKRNIVGQISRKYQEVIGATSIVLTIIAISIPIFKGFLEILIEIRLFTMEINANGDRMEETYFIRIRNLM